MALLSGPSDELLDAKVLETLDELTELCGKRAEETAGSKDKRPTQNPPESLIEWNERFRVAEHSRRVAFRTDQHVDVEGIMALNEIYRKEAKVVKELQQYLISRALRAKTKQRAQSLDMSWPLRTTPQGFNMTKDDYLMVACGLTDKITHDVDRLTRSAGLINESPVLPATDLAHHAEEALETFFEYYGNANEAELFNLSRMLDLSRPLLVEFFRCKRNVTVNSRTARVLLDRKLQAHRREMKRKAEVLKQIWVVKKQKQRDAELKSVEVADMD